MPAVPARSCLRHSPAAIRLKPPLKRDAPPKARSGQLQRLPWRGRRIQTTLAVPSAPLVADAAGGGSDWDGPDPYGDFQRIFTAEGGIKLRFMVKDLRLWPRLWRAGLWCAAMGATLWLAVHASPYPLVPRGCTLFGPCPTSVPPKQSVINLVLLGLMGLVYADLLLRERWLRASIEIRPDCMILDDADVFWRRHMDLGWPALGYDIEAKAITLSGVYGTRRVTYVVLHPVDENDCTVQVLGAQLKMAFEQLWDQPGG